jgi:hypothetical protein
MPTESSDQNSTMIDLSGSVLNRSSIHSIVMPRLYRPGGGERLQRVAWSALVLAAAFVVACADGMPAVVPFTFSATGRRRHDQAATATLAWRAGFFEQDKAGGPARREC